MDCLNLTREQADTARALIQGYCRTLDNPAFPRANAWFNQCYHQPRRLARIMACLNELLEMHGAEAIRSTSGQIVAEYLNAGDTYSATLIFNHKTEAFQLSTMGDFVERNQRRYSIA